jgi:cobalt/nickel transport protein
MKNLKPLFVIIIITLIIMDVKAHFQVILPNADKIDNLSKDFRFEILFTHPMEQGPVMQMGTPKQFGVMVDGKKTSLLKSLKEIKLQGKRAYELLYKFKAPGDYIFFIEPAPYWEPAEQKMIVHYTKVIVDVLGAESGWDEMVGFPVEIEPLSRPYSLYTGNIFQGIVKKNGKPVPFAEVEVELYNKGSVYKAPADVYVTQVIKADANGVFSYAIPKAGWWGFAALIDGDKKMKNPKGKEVDVELGAVIWVKATDMKKTK